MAYVNRRFIVLRLIYSLPRENTVSLEKDGGPNDQRNENTNFA